MLEQDTIVAIATAHGKGGVGIVRLSGKNAVAIAKQIHFSDLKPRYAHYCQFYQNQNPSDNNLLDAGIALYFKAPHSFTGEDVVELQGHGGPVILDALVKECIKLGARMAKPGEFSERAFLNDKLDLAQAEAIADLIESSSLEAAKNAVRSLQGDFSKKIHSLVEACIQLRIYVEAAIDFPEEEIDFLSDGHVGQSLQQLILRLEAIIAGANQGRLLQEGLSIVIAGKPNAGKSSLLNALAGHEAAIVTDIEGTTRDTVKEQILIDGMPVFIIDTAGLRQSADVVEKIGIEKALAAIEQADDILLVRDSSDKTPYSLESLLPELSQKLQSLKHITVIHNKCDLTGNPPNLEDKGQETHIHLSAKNQQGVDLLRQHIKKMAGFHQSNEGGFTARRRHLDALEKALVLLQQGQLQLQQSQAGELLAEDLRQAQQFLNEITGEFSADDLLGEIFSSFCIGK